MKIEKIYQTIIIGAGPAGLIAGRYLKNSLILEKKEDDYSMRCVGMSVKSFELQNIIPDTSLIRTESYKIERIMPNGKIIGRVHDSPVGYVVEKFYLEKFFSTLIKSKLKLGRKVVDINFKGGVWNVITNKGECFKSRYLIGADGFNSIVRKKIFPENRKNIVFTYGLEYVIEFYKKIDPHIIKIYLDNQKYSNGYAWIFPRSKFTANIGVGGKGNLYEIMDNFFQNEIRKYCGDCKILNKEFGAIASKSNDIKLFKSNAFLVGDAAGFADPVFKAGTIQAILSGKIAAECIIDNKAELYNSKIKSMSFADPALIKANEIFYSFSNQTLNELGDVLEGRSFNYLKTLQGSVKILSKKNLRKDIIRLFNFVTIWQKNRDWLW